jgi:hypothetical protein
MVTLEFHEPTGRLEARQPHAPRLDALEGKRIGFVSNEQWQAFRMLPLLEDSRGAPAPGRRLRVDRDRREQAGA